MPPAIRTTRPTSSSCCWRASIRRPSRRWRTTATRRWETTPRHWPRRPHRSAATPTSSACVRVPGLQRRYCSRRRNWRRSAASASAPIIGTCRPQAFAAFPCSTPRSRIRAASPNSCSARSSCCCAGFRREERRPAPGGWKRAPVIREARRQDAWHRRLRPHRHQIGVLAEQLGIGDLLRH